jgi:hypothetical protein
VQKGKLAPNDQRFSTRLGCEVSVGSRCVCGPDRILCAMWPVVALILTSAVAAAVTVRAARGDVPSREVPWDLGDNARKMVTISSSLAGFTITGVVLLLSFAREPGGIETPLTVAVGMFLVAFMGLIAGALMYANQAPPGLVFSGISIQTVQYSITTMMFFRSVFFGLLALRPLVEAYGLNELARHVGWLVLVLAVVGGWTSSIAVLFRLGIVRVRAVVLVPLVSFLGCAAAAVIFSVWFPEARSEASALYLGYVLFALNAVSFLSYTLLVTSLEHPRWGPVIARVWAAGVAVAAVISAMTIGFIWLATAGLL